MGESGPGRRKASDVAHVAPPGQAARPGREGRRRKVARFWLSVRPWPSRFHLKNEFLLRQRCFIRGAWTEASDGRTITVKNPATGGVIGTVPRMGTDEARRAVEAAARRPARPGGPGPPRSAPPSCAGGSS